MPTQSIIDRCRAIWRKANREPVTIYLSSPRELDRTRYTLYNALKPRETDFALQQELAFLKDNCEILIDRTALTLTVQRKDINNTQIRIMEALEDALGEYQTEEAEAAPAPSPEESLKRLKEMTQKENGAGVASRRPANPYFKREED